jgi:cell fate regulator YaaT (PSP1 superfamily)
MELKLNDVVLLQTKRGKEVGLVRVESGDHKLGPKESVQGEVLRRPTIEESQEFTVLKKWDFREIRRTFRELAKEHKLPMRFESAEKLLGGEKLVIYFTSEDRVDFRELVKDLSDKYEMRIELHQVGARDAAKLTGDVGVCGIELCCSSYIIGFVPVSMKMAKTQRISLDPAKISGQCGRLKCCLKYEDDLYNKLRKNVPMVGQPCSCDGKDCHACNVDILGQKVTLDFGDGHRETFDVEDVDFEAGWSDKDIRRYRKERRARIKARKSATLKSASGPTVAPQSEKTRPNVVKQKSNRIPVDEPKMRRVHQAHQSQMQEQLNRPQIRNR